MLCVAASVNEFSSKNMFHVISLDEKSNDVDLSASEDWDVKTITSALKLYLR